MLFSIWVVVLYGVDIMTEMKNQNAVRKKCGFKYHHTEENKPCALMGDVRTEHFTYLTKEQWSDSQDKVNFMEV